MLRSRWLSWMALLSLVATVSGCANFRRLDRDLEEIEALAHITGEVTSRDWPGTPIILVVARQPEHKGMPIQVIHRELLLEPGPYEFHLHPGIYMLGAFEDQNGDERLQPETERIGLYRNMEPLPLSANDVLASIDIEITDEIPEVLRAPDIKAEEAIQYVRTGELVSLSDDRFAPETGPFGMWQPFSFLEKYGAGILMLEPYDPGRIPVLFVHGISGYPREFEFLISQLDHTRFQAWVAQYPSGWRLGKLASFFEEQCNRLQLKYQFSEMELVAHSMGGLVARNLLTLHAEHHSTPYIRSFVTIASPLGGLASADTGVGMAPSVVPSWRDIGPKSEFITTLFDKPLNPGIQYSLFFTFGGGSRTSKEATDGVVPLAVQLRKDAQLEASRSFGFDDTHTGVLKDPSAAEALNLVLESRLDASRGK